MYVPGPTIGRIRLGQRLQALREANGISRQAAARVIKKRSEDSIRHFETGHRVIRPLELDVLAQHYGCSAEVVRELEELHAQASKRGEFSSFGLPENMLTYLGLERDASEIRTSQNLIVPGLLQIESYIRRLFELGNLEPSVVDNRVQARLKRQERLSPSPAAPEPVRLIAVVAEEALRRCARVPGVGHAQLDHLIDCASRPNIEIRIINLDAGMHVGMDGSFTYLTFPEGLIGDVAYQEMQSGGQLSDDITVVRYLDTMFTERRGQALDPAESLALLTQIANTR